MSKPDGGPAFGGEIDDVYIDTTGANAPQQFARRVIGMSLRDYFAGQVIAGICAQGSSVYINGAFYNHEKAAYMLADAMIAERAK